jgi:hypothetical protein
VGSGSLSGANLSSQSLPTVPSLPSISRSSTPGSRPGSSFSHIGTSHPGLHSAGNSLGIQAEMRGAAVVARSSPLVYALVAVLLVAIAVLAVLLLSN